MRTVQENNSIAIGDDQGQIVVIINGSVYVNASIKDFSKVDAALNFGAKDLLIDGCDKLLLLKSSILRHIDNMLVTHCDQESIYTSKNLYQ